MDASAFIAIIAGEADADHLADILERAETRYWSALSVWETVAGLRRSHGYPTAAAQAEVGVFGAVGDFKLIVIGEREQALALDAYARYGKGRHRACLNMGDCFAYACARANNARLLFKGDDFTHTDIAPA